jgi:hypothetical protein
MAKNTSREFAMMDDDERRRFALEQPNENADEDVRPVEFPPDDPRRQTRSDRHSGGAIP